MNEGTFQIATSEDGKSRKDHPYVDSFEAHGHAWVIHRKLYGLGFRVSHMVSGFAVPQSDANDQETAKTQAMAFLDAKAAQIPRVVAEVMR